MSDSYSDVSDSEEPVQNASNDLVMTKYKMAGEIASNALKAVIAGCVVGASVIHLCQIGDQLIESSSSKIFVKDKKMKKGIAFPTCISVNNCICHYSPLQSDSGAILNEDDVVKIDLGVHIDGYAACVATTVAVGCSKSHPITGRKADVMMAGYVASEVALRLFRPENTNHMVTDILTAVAADFKCKPMEGLLSHRVEKDNPECDEMIILNPTDLIRKDYKKAMFNPWDVYTLDIFITTSDDAKSKEHDTRTTVFRRTPHSYNLKLKISREVLKQAVNKSGDYAFSLRSFEGESKARLGIKECVEHHLLMTYPVLYEKDGEFVSHFKYTIIVGPNGPIKVVSPIFSKESVKCEFRLRNPDLIKTLNEPLIQKKELKPSVETIIN